MSFIKRIQNELDPIFTSSQPDPTFFMSFVFFEAVSELMEMVFRGLGPSHSSLLRLFLLLESREQGDEKRERSGVQKDKMVDNKLTWKVEWLMNNIEWPK